MGKVKNKIFEYCKLIEEFEIEKNYFNSVVADVIEYENLDIQSEDLNYYNDALIFNENWGFLFDSIECDNVDKLSSKYLNDIQIKSIIVVKIMDKIMECTKYDSDINITFNEIRQLYDQYKLYKDCGFFELKQIDDDIKILGKELNESKDEFVRDSINKISELSNQMSDIVSPYGEVAKEQFNDVKIKTKSIVNKYNKKMLDFLSKIDEKTK